MAEIYTCNELRMHAGIRPIKTIAVIWIEPDDLSTLVPNFRSFTILVPNAHSFAIVGLN